MLGSCLKTLPIAYTRKIEDRYAPQKLLQPFYHAKAIKMKLLTTVPIQQNMQDCGQQEREKNYFTPHMQRQIQASSEPLKIALNCYTVILQRQVNIYDS
jgi:hypothetical protein